jgi:hypothetical protein
MPIAVWIIFSCAQALAQRVGALQLTFFEEPVSQNDAFPNLVKLR